MKKICMMLGALSVVFLMVSTVTALPQTQSTPVMSAVHSLEETKEQYDDTTLGSMLDIQPTGFIDTLIAFIKLLIQLIMNIITVIQGILSVVALIQAIFSAITMIIELVRQIIDLFNPTSEALMG